MLSCASAWFTLHLHILHRKPVWSRYTTKHALVNFLSPTFSHAGLKVLCWAVEVSWGTSIVPQHSGIFIGLRGKVFCYLCGERSYCFLSAFTLCGLLKIASPSWLLPPLFYVTSICVVWKALHTLPCSSQHYFREVEGTQCAVAFLNKQELRAWIAVRKSVAICGGGMSASCSTQHWIVLFCIS